MSTRNHLTSHLTWRLTSRSRQIRRAGSGGDDDMAQRRESADDLADRAVVQTHLAQGRHQMVDHPVEITGRDMETAMSCRHIGTGVAPRPPGRGDEEGNLMPPQPIHVDVLEVTA